jgi:cytochrome oxidase assembly protein ShyY1
MMNKTYVFLGIVASAVTIVLGLWQLAERLRL